MILDLVPPGSDILRTKTERFDFTDPPTNPVELYQNLANTMLEHDGIGLAAVQCGLPYRVFVVRSDPVMGFFNPTIVDESEEVIELEEGCLSYPGVLLKVKRPRKIRIRFADALGEIVSKPFDSLTSRIIQHEMDHLDGILFGETVSRLQLEMAIKKTKKTGYTYSIGDFL